MLRRFLLTAAMMSAFAAPAMAAPTTFTLSDKLHTQVLFFVEHMGFSHSSGKFLGFDGTFTFDPENPKAGGEANVTIDTNSLNMDDATWEEHLKAPDMFNTAAFPTMTFKSTKVDVTGDKTAKMTGDLTLLGQTKPVTLDVTLNKCGEHPMSKKLTCGFDAVGTLKRSDFGMTKAIPMVSDEVKIQITVEAPAQDAAAAK